MPISTLTWRLKRFHYLLQRIAGSVAQRGLRSTIARISQEFRVLPAEEANWGLVTLDAPFHPFTLPNSEAPDVSVIIPVHGKLAWTIACLRSIASHPTDVSLEVIVVDDASPDDTANVLVRVEGLRLLRNEVNLGFVGSSNAGAVAARGRYLLFLNNDTQVTPGWLDRLVQTFVEEPRCGIVGSRLVYPDGRLQEAGGLVYADAQAWNVGRFENCEDPRYLFRRNVDYVSGASLMIKSSLFERIGGFDTRYAPAYCEDMDLAFAVRNSGQRVIYEPASLIVHCEGISSGTDPFVGVKQYQIANRAKFVNKWPEALQRQPAPRTPVERAIHHGRRHILIMDALTPEPTRDAGSMQLYNIMQLLHGMGWRVTFMADNRQATPDEIRTLGRVGVQTLCKPWSPSLASWLAREGDTLNAVMLCRYYVADSNLSLIRRLAPKAKLLFDTTDLHFLREQRAAEHTGSAALARQAAATRKREFAVMRASDATFVVSTAEQELLARELPQANVLLLPNMHAVQKRGPDFQHRGGLVFVGGFGHPPNEDAVRWLVTDIYPKVRAQRPEISLHLIGDMPDAARQQFQGNGVVVHGRVEDLSGWMHSTRIALAPLRYGAGVKGKVNTAMSYGLPVVVTSIAAEGMRLRDGDNVLVADDADAFAAAILRLYDDELLWNRISTASMAHVQRYFSFETARETLKAALG